MQPTLKWTLVAAAACCLGLAASGPSLARNICYAYPAQAYSIYQAPDGTYDSLADLTRDIDGTPCGVECTREAQARWSRPVYHRHYGE